MLAGALLLLWRTTLTPLRVIAAAIAGFLTDYIVRAAIRLIIRPVADWYDYADWAYSGLFGLTVRFARLFHAGYHRNDEWILPGEETAAVADFWFHVGVWTSIFAAIYCLAVRWTPKTI